MMVLVIQARHSKPNYEISLPDVICELLSAPYWRIAVVLPWDARRASRSLTFDLLHFLRIIPELEKLWLAVFEPFPGRRPSSSSPSLVFAGCKQ